MKQKITYNKAIIELEEILEKIEHEEIDLDDLTVKIKRASELIQICKDKLRSTETEVDKVLKQMEDDDKA